MQLPFDSKLKLNEILNRHGNTMKFTNNQRNETIVGGGLSLNRRNALE